MAARNRVAAVAGAAVLTVAGIGAATMLSSSSSLAVTTTSYANLDAQVAKFRKSSPNIAAAFDAVKVIDQSQDARIAALEAATAPVTTAPTTTAPPVTTPVPPVTTTSPVDQGTANVWVDPNGGSCARVAVAAAYSDSAACASLERAYNAAARGDSIAIKAGTYASEDWAQGSNKTSGTGYVSFAPAPGETVSVGNVQMGHSGYPSVGSHIRMGGFSIDHLFMHLTDDLLLNNMALTSFFTRGATNVTMTGGSIGNMQNGDSPTVGRYAGEPTSQNVTFDGVSFHDIGRNSCAGCHVECLFIQEGINTVVRDSSFQRCAIMDIFMSGQGLAGQGGQNISGTVENNWFGPPTDGGTNALRINPDTAVVTMNIRNNSFVYGGGSISLDVTGGCGGQKAAPCYTGTKLSGNVGRIPPGGCVSGGSVVYSRNLLDSTSDTCGAGDTTTSDFGYVNNAGFNLHLAPSSAALNHGDPSNFPSTDIDGDPRPLGGGVDAGSDER